VLNAVGAQVVAGVAAEREAQQGGSRLKRIFRRKRGG
jgi:hypothetical protein